MLAGGGATVDDVLEPSETLDGSDRFNTAQDALGDDLTAAFFLDFAPVVSLIESTGAATSDPSYQMAKPYLDRARLRRRRQQARRRSDLGGFVLGVKEAPRRDRGHGGGGHHPLTASAAAPGVGIDLIEIERIERALRRRPRLAERLFQPGELAFAESRARPATPPGGALRRQGGGDQGAGRRLRAPRRRGDGGRQEPPALRAPRTGRGRAPSARGCR